MARKKPARPAKKAKKQAKKKTQARPATRRSSKKAARKAAKKGAKQAAKKAAKKSAAKRAARPARKAQPAPKARPKGRPTSAVKKPAGAAVLARADAAMSAKKKPNLDRPRKTVADVHGIPSSLDINRAASAAKTGRQELKERLSKNTSASPALTSGDVDADWESAETVGDEAPGGDNPTPDQDVVDDIGRALGVEYDDDEELQGGAEIADRDRHRWELDPASKDIDEDEE